MAEAGLRPINGWSCWGLGYLDKERKKAGCLLHPFQNQGTDYRGLTDYGAKCARELCLEARTFEILAEKTRTFYISLTKGMDSFEYSSRRYNPVFGLLLWGAGICEAIATYEAFGPLDRETVLARYALLVDMLSYKSDGYVIERGVVDKGVAWLLRPGFSGDYIRWRKKMVEKILSSVAIRAKSADKAVRRPIHVFAVPLSFSRLLKFGLDVWEADEKTVEALKYMIDEEIGTFIGGYGR